MASTYVNDLRLNELATGDASGTWGTITNTNLELIAEAFSFGTEGITTNADTHTSTIADGATDPVRSMYVKYTGTLDSACTITIAPNTVSKLWFIENGTSGSQNIIISQGTGANVTIPAGDTKVVYSDGAGSGAAVVDAFASLSTVDLKVQDDLTVTDDASVGGDLLVSGEVQTANIGFTDGDNAITIADGGGITAANGITSTAAANTFGATSFNDANITNVGDIALDSLSADDSSISIASPVVINGTTPTLTIGDAGAEDTKIVFDGNAQDYYIGLDDSADDLIIGRGSTVGTTPNIQINESNEIHFSPADGDVKVFIGSAGGAFGGNSSHNIRASSNDLMFNSVANYLYEVGGSEKFRITSDGKLGVGTTNPSTAVDINADNGDQLRLDNDGDRFTQLTLANNGTTKANFNFDNTDALAEIFAISGAGLKLSTGGSERARLLSGGQLLVGLTAVSGSSSAVLQARGTGAAACVFDRTNDGVVVGFKRNGGSDVGSISITSSSTAFNTSSDARLKKVTGSSRGLEVITALNPVSYNWKADGKADEGLIAQEVLDIVPNAVSGSEEEYYQMDYSKLVTPLVKAIQEQQTQIEALQSEINTLKGG